LRHSILSKTPCAEADPLAKGTYPTLISAIVYKVALILRLQAERTKLSIADVVLVTKCIFHTGAFRDLLEID